MSDLGYTQESRGESAEITVRFHSFERLYKRYESPFLASIARLGSGMAPLFSSEVDNLQEKLQEYVNVPRVIVVSSGTAAITLALTAMDLPRQSIVLCPTYTFVGTANAIRAAGLRPFFVDSSTDSHNISSETIRDAFDMASRIGRVSALVSVDMFGHPVEHQKIEKLVAELGLHWICDNAQSFGTTTGRASVMVFGDIATTSFYPAKVLGGVTDGGCLFTHSHALADRIELLKNQGWNSDLTQHVPGGANARLSTIAAAFLSIRLDGIDSEISERCSICRIYDGVLAGRASSLLRERTGWNGYMYHVRSSDLAQTREHFLANGIETRRYYERLLHQLPAYTAARDVHQRFPNAERLSATTLCVPLHPFLEEPEIERASRALRNAPGIV